MSAIAALLLALLGTDRLGDPLGFGTSVRYGTTRLSAGRDNVYRLVFHPNRDEVYATATVHDGFNNGVPPRTHGWEARSGKQTFRSDPGFQKLTFDATGRFRIEARPGGTVRVWDTAAGREFGRATFDRTTDVAPVGFHAGRLAVGEWVGPMGGGRSRIVTRTLTGDQPAASELPVQLGDEVTVAPDGRLAVLTGQSFFNRDGDTPEWRSFDPFTRRLLSWRSIPAGDDYDPSPRRDLVDSGRRVIVMQFRTDEKADRFRGFPECRVSVLDAAGRREARYEFRLDDIGTGSRLLRSEEGDGGYGFRNFTPSEDGQFLTWIDHDDHLRVRHLPTGRVVTAPGRYRENVRPTFSPNGKRLAVLDGDCIVRLIDPYTGRFQHTADSPATAAKQATVSPDGKLVATGHACGEVWVWDAVTGKPLWRTEPDGEPVRELHFNPTGTTVSVVGFWGPIGVRTFDATTGRELGPMLPYRYFRTVAVSADGKQIADLVEEKGVMEKGGWAYPLFVRTRDIATGKELKRVRLDHRLGLGNESHAVTSRDGRVMVVTHNADGGETIAYDTATGKRLAAFPSRLDMNAVWALSGDGRIAVRSAPIPGEDLNKVSVFELGSPTPDKPIREYTTTGIPATGVVSPDGRAFAISDRISASVFELRADSIPMGFGEPVVAFFPDGKPLTLPGIRGAEQWSLEPPAWKLAPPAKPTAERLAKLWKWLENPDVPVCWEITHLARHPTEAVPFLTAKLLTELPDANTVAGHIGNLGSKAFAERDAATKVLRELGPAVVPALRAALKSDPSPEARNRIEKLIPVLTDTAAPFTLARLRAVEALERCGTADARAALKQVAARPGTPWADDAARALTRLAR